MRYLPFVLFICLCHKQIVMQVVGESDRERLADDLLKNYAALIDPGNITLEMTPAIVDLEFDPSSDVLTVSAWERYKWTDYRLRWDPAEYGGLAELRLPSKYLWTPDIMVYNLYMGEFSRTPVNAFVTSDGGILWVPPCVFKVRCNRNHGKDKTLPMKDNDVVTCPIKMGSWTYDGYQINLTATQQEVDLENYIINPNLDVMSSEASIKSVFYDCCSEPYTSYEATLKLKLNN